MISVREYLFHNSLSPVTLCRRSCILLNSNCKNADALLNSSRTCIRCYFESSSGCTDFLKSKYCMLLYAKTKVIITNYDYFGQDLLSYSEVLLLHFLFITATCELK